MQSHVQLGKKVPYKIHKIFSRSLRPSLPLYFSTNLPHRRCPAYRAFTQSSKKSHRNRVIAACVIIPEKEKKTRLVVRSTLVHACNRFPAPAIDYFPFSRLAPLIVNALVPADRRRSDTIDASSTYRSASTNCSQLSGRAHLRSCLALLSACVNKRFDEMHARSECLFLSLTFTEICLIIRSKYFATNNLGNFLGFSFDSLLELQLKWN